MDILLWNAPKTRSIFGSDTDIKGATDVRAKLGSTTWSSDIDFAHLFEGTSLGKSLTPDKGIDASNEPSSVEKAKDRMEPKWSDSPPYFRPRDRSPESGGKGTPGRAGVAESEASGNFSSRHNSGRSSARTGSGRQTDQAIVNKRLSQTTVKPADATLPPRSVTPNGRSLPGSARSGLKSIQSQPHFGVAGSGSSYPSSRCSTPGLGIDRSSSSMMSEDDGGFALKLRHRVELFRDTKRVNSQVTAPIPNKGREFCPPLSAVSDEVPDSWFFQHPPSRTEQVIIEKLNPIPTFYQEGMARGDEIRLKKKEKEMIGLPEPDPDTKKGGKDKKKDKAKKDADQEPEEPEWWEPPPKSPREFASDVISAHIGATATAVLNIQRPKYTTEEWEAYMKYLEQQEKKRKEKEKVKAAKLKAKEMERAAAGKQKAKKKPKAPKRVPPTPLNLYEFWTGAAMKVARQHPVEYDAVEAAERERVDVPRPIPTGRAEIPQPKMPVVVTPPPPDASKLRHTSGAMPCEGHDEESEHLLRRLGAAQLADAVSDKMILALQEASQKLSKTGLPEDVMSHASEDKGGWRKMPESEACKSLEVRREEALKWPHDEVALIDKRMKLDNLKSSWSMQEARLDWTLSKDRSIVARDLIEDLQYSLKLSGPGSEGEAPVAAAGKDVDQDEENADSLSVPSDWLGSGGGSSIDLDNLPSISKAPRKLTHLKMQAGRKPKSPSPLHSPPKEEKAKAPEETEWSTLGALKDGNSREVTHRTQEAEVEDEDELDEEQRAAKEAEREAERAEAERVEAETARKLVEEAELAQQAVQEWVWQQEDVDSTKYTVQHHDLPDDLPGTWVGVESAVKMPHSITYDTLTHRVVREVMQDPLNINLAHSKVGMRGMCALSACLPRGKHLTSIILQDNPIQNAGFQALANALNECASLDVLNISSTGLTWESMPALGVLLRRLKEVRLRGNNLGDKGATILGSYLFSYRGHNIDALTGVDVSECRILDRGMCALAEAFQENIHLKWLNLSWNNINPRGAQALGVLLTTNPTLQWLDMSYMGLSDKGGGFIAEAMRDNPALYHLNLASNGLQQDFCIVMSQSLELKENKLGTLVLDGNPLGEYGTMELLEALFIGSLEKLSLNGCSFVDIEGTKVNYNEDRPDGVYEIDLAKPPERVVAEKLVELWRDHGPASWRSSSLNNASFKLTEKMNWPARMPLQGILKVAFKCTKRVLVTSQPLTEQEFQDVWEDVAGNKQCFDAWRLDYLKMLTKMNVTFLASQAREVLQIFDWGDVQLEAAVVIFGRIKDLENVESVLEVFGPPGSTMRNSLYERMSLLDRFHPANLTAHYVLNLSMQIDFTIAVRLLEFYRDEVTQGYCDRGQRVYFGAPLYSCWRNVTYNGEPIDDIHPFTYELPDEGTLALDFVTYKLPNCTAHLSKNADGNRVPYREFKEKLKRQVPIIPMQTGRFAKMILLLTDADALSSFKSGEKILPRLMNLPQAHLDMAIKAKHLQQSRRKKVGSEMEGAAAFGGTRGQHTVGKTVADPEKALSLLRVLSTERYFTCEQVMEMQDIFLEPRHRAQLTIIMYSRIVDTIEFANVLQHLHPSAQVQVCQHLGWLNCARIEPDLHYVLHLNRPEEYEMARRLARMARNGGKRVPAGGDEEEATVVDNTINFQRLLINGKLTRISEDYRMWDVLSGKPAVHQKEVPNNVLEFDFVSSKEQRKYAAATYIQSRWRSIVQRKRYMTMWQACRKIQIAFRGYLYARLRKVREAEKKRRIRQKMKAYSVLHHL